MCDCKGRSYTVLLDWSPDHQILQKSCDSQIIQAGVTEVLVLHLPTWVSKTVMACASLHKSITPAVAHTIISIRVIIMYVTLRTRMLSTHTALPYLHVPCTISFITHFLLLISPFPHSSLPVGITHFCGFHLCCNKQVQCNTHF